MHAFQDVREAARNLVQLSVTPCNSARNFSAPRSRANAQVDEVVWVASKIAEHTKHLVLKANIEAAYAGDVAKRLNVIAGEVQRLAEQAERMAEQITRRITIAQRSSEEAADTVSQIRATIDPICKSEITDLGALTPKQAVTNEVARQIWKSAWRSAHISERFVAEMTERARSGGAGAAKAASELARIADKLQHW